MLSLLVAVIEHLLITFAGVAVAIVFGVAIGVLISKKPILAGPVLTIADIIQTIPALALLAMLMIIFGLGNTPLIIGLSLYSLLPIIRNTFTGINSVLPPIREAARGMGMSQIQSLWRVEMPLALPMIISGIRIALVTALGTTVIGVLIGSGGLGYIIYSGIQTQNWGTILEGTIPVVLLSVLAQFLFNKLQQLQRRAKKYV